MFKVKYFKDRNGGSQILSYSSNKDVLEKATKLKWKWGGHVARLHTERWAHATTMCDPYMGQRGQGQPKRRWADILIAGAGKQWLRQIKDRKKMERTRKRTTSKVPYSQSFFFSLLFRDASTSLVISRLGSSGVCQEAVYFYCCVINVSLLIY